MSLTLIWQAEAPEEIYLTDRGIPVLATDSVANRNDAPRNAKLVTSISVNFPTMRQMTTNGHLTPLGNSFCKNRGVEADANSLKAYVSTTEGQNIPYKLG